MSFIFSILSYCEQDADGFKRDIEDLFARDVPHTPAPVAPVGHPGAPNDQSGALFFGKILRAGAKALFGREEEMYARDDIFEARSLNELD